MTSRTTAFTRGGRTALIAPLVGVAIAAGLQAPATATPHSAVAQPAAAAKSCDVTGEGSGPRRDCITLEHAGPDTARKGERGMLRGRATSGVAAVRIERAVGGNRWTDPKRVKRWRTVTTAEVSANGRFRAPYRATSGLHTLRAVAVRGGTLIGSAAAGGVMTSAHETVQSGSHGWSYLFRNSSGRSLKLVTIANDGATGKSIESDPQNFPDGAYHQMIALNPGKDLGVGFRLIQGSSIIGKPSEYSFYGNAGKKPCSETSTPRLGNRDLVRVEFEDQTFGYYGTMTFPDGKSCTFHMLTSFQSGWKDQPTWAKVLEIAAAVVVVLVVAYAVVTAVGAAALAFPQQAAFLSAKAMTTLKGAAWAFAVEQALTRMGEAFSKDPGSIEQRSTVTFDGTQFDSWRF